MLDSVVGSCVEFGCCSCLTQLLDFLDMAVGCARPNCGFWWILILALVGFGSVFGSWFVGIVLPFPSLWRSAQQSSFGLVLVLVLLVWFWLVWFLLVLFGFPLMWIFYMAWSAGWPLA